MFSFLDSFPSHLLSVFASSGFLPLQPAPVDNKMEDLDAILKKYTSEVENHLRGATFIAVDKNGKTLYSKSMGYRTFDDEEKSPLQPDSVMWIASLTKLVTAIACMIAVEKGLITLDQNVREIVPELGDVEILLGFEDGEAPRKPITKKIDAPISLRQLLSHQSGYAYDQLSPQLKEWSAYHKKTEWTMSGSMAGYTHPLLFEPSKGWTYGAGMDWAGRTIEIITNQSLETFMQTHIFTRLSLTSTTFHPELDPSLAARAMTMGFRNPLTKSLTPGPNPWASGSTAKDCCGGCGLSSTASDFSKILSAFLCDGGSILSKKSVNEIMTSQLVDPSFFLQVINGPGRAHLGQTWPEGAQATFGLSSSINLEDFPGRRKKGSANWSGMPGLHAWVDRETGVAGLLTTQVLPPGDPMVTKCLLELETALYSHLRSA